jgi:hypothetical protein
MGVTTDANSVLFSLQKSLTGEIHWSLHPVLNYYSLAALPGYHKRLRSVRGRPQDRTGGRVRRRREDVGGGREAAAGGHPRTLGLDALEPVRGCAPPLPDCRKMRERNGYSFLLSLQCLLLPDLRAGRGRAMTFTRVLHWQCSSKSGVIESDG